MQITLCYCALIAVSLNLSYWIWVQESSIVTQSSRAMIMEILKHMEFRCLLTNGVWISPGSGNQYKCSSFDSDGFHCQVNGREILAVTQGVGTGDSYWYYFAYLCAIFLFFKTGVALLTMYPWDRVRLLNICGLTLELLYVA